MPGDEIIKNSMRARDLAVTNAVTIKARPSDIWPWLVQMGYGRGGMYSLNRLLMILLLQIIDPGSFLMTRKHLLGIKQRAEALTEQCPKQGE